MSRLMALLVALFSPLFPQTPHQPERISLPPPTLASIFQTDHTWTATLSAELKFTLLATGDVLPARTINAQSNAVNDYLWPWRSVRDLLTAPDLTFINLETPIVDKCPVTKIGTVFCGSPRLVEGLAWADIDVVNLANNHIGNYEQEGIQSTVAYLESSGIRTVGITNPTIVQTKDIQVAFLGFNNIYPEFPGGEWAHLDVVQRQISEVRTKADIVVVQFHWGTEYTTSIIPLQKQLGYLAIDSGADLVIGNHPHWIQPLEVYKDKVIVYAHGNFIFDQFWSEKTLQGIVSRFTFYDSQLVDVQIIPILIDRLGAPQVAPADLGQKILTNLEAESYRIQNQLPTGVTSGNLVELE